MLVVVDTNIIVASLIRDSATRRILVSSDIDFIVPEWVRAEVREHIAEISAKAGVPAEELEHFMEELFQTVLTVPLDEYAGSIQEARRLMEKTDRDDVPFLALAIAFGADAIWTSDRHFGRQKRVPVVSTEDLLRRR